MAWWDDLFGGSNPGMGNITGNMAGNNITGNDAGAKGFDFSKFGMLSQMSGLGGLMGQAAPQDGDMLKTLMAKNNYGQQPMPQQMPAFNQMPMMARFAQNPGILRGMR